MRIIVGLVFGPSGLSPGEVRDGENDGGLRIRKHPCVGRIDPETGSPTSLKALRVWPDRRPRYTPGRFLTSTRGAGHLVAALDALGDPATKLIRFLDDDRAAAAPATFVPAPLAIPAALAPIIVPALVAWINPHAARSNLDALG